MTLPWLTVLGLIPIVGALLLCLPVFKHVGKVVGLAFSLLTFGVGSCVTVLYLGGLNLNEQISWMPAFGTYWALAVDGMGLLLVLLTATLVPVVLIAEWNIAERIQQANPEAKRWDGRAFFALVLLLEGLCLFVFMAQDVLLFYLLFEATLLPMYFLIGGFGGSRRSYAATKFLLFGLVGGLIMLVSVIGVYVWSETEAGNPTYLISELTKLDTGATGSLLMICFLVAFILKAPMVPVHVWLPTTAEEATPGTSALLVGIMDKMGTFGMIKICLALFPQESINAAPVMITLALISILYGGLAAVSSPNLLRLVAYTSVSHFGFMVLGIYTFTSVGMSGSIFYMVNHGFSTAALFLALGYLIKRGGSAKIADYGGVQKVAPVMAGVVLVAGLSALALPGMSSFVSEFMVLAGAWSRIPWVAIIAALGMVLAAVYVLRMYQRVMTGSLESELATKIGVDLDLKERLIAGFLILVILVLGFVPNLALGIIEPTAVNIVGVLGLSDPMPQLGGK
ncbi:MAG: NADH-quinone oxidoreductase subunit M [Propionibacteriaceae bacterium]|nr:NADH-quinone oxidoreductase subunit M [Propionibacteriaceae bacterium]